MGAPSVAARVIAAEFSLEHAEFGIRKLVRRHLVRADNLAQHIDLAEADLANHVDELSEFNLTVAARIDLFDQTGDLFCRQILSKVLESRSDLGRVNAVEASSVETKREQSNVNVLPRCRMQNSNFHVEKDTAASVEIKREKTCKNGNGTRQFPGIEVHNPSIMTNLPSPLVS